MALTVRSPRESTIDGQMLRRLEINFMAPEIRNRDDIAVRHHRLAQMVSTEIVPRLLRLHLVGEADDATAMGHPTEADISGLAEIVMGDDLGASASYVSGLRDRGLAMETLFVELLEPTARALGAMWDRDECDFIDVTLGVARLQKLLAIFNATHAEPSLDARRQVLMAMTPGDQHHFGAAMVSKFLRAGGWSVHDEPDATIEAIAAEVETNWYAVAGLTLGATRQIEALVATIAAIRARSQNAAIGVMVGGPLFTANPDLAREIGADATAANAPAAVLVAQKLLDIGILSNWAPRHG